MKIRPPDLAERPAVHRRDGAAQVERFWTKKSVPGDHDRLKPVVRRVIEHLKFCGTHYFSGAPAPRHGTPAPGALRNRDDEGPAPPGARKTP